MKKSEIFNEDQKNVFLVDKSKIKPDINFFCESCGDDILFSIQKIWNPFLNRYEIEITDRELCANCLQFDTSNEIESKINHLDYCTGCQQRIYTNYKTSFVKNGDKSQYLIDFKNSNFETVYCSNIECEEMGIKKPRQTPLFFYNKLDLINWQRSQGLKGCKLDDISDEGLLNEMNQNGWYDKIDGAYRVVTDEEIKNGYWNNK